MNRHQDDAGKYLVDDYERCRCGHYACNHWEDPPFDAACMEDGCTCEAFEERFPEVERERA